MKLLTKAILQQFEKIGSQANSADPILVCKFSDPCSQRTWYAAEFEQQTGIFFWYVIGIENEWWTFSLAELEAYDWPLGIWIERDRYFRSCKFSELKGF